MGTVRDSNKMQYHPGDYGVAKAGDSGQWLSQGLSQARRNLP